MRVSLLGTGALGEAIGERLLACGHELTVYNRTADKARALIDRGARAAASPAVTAAHETLVLVLRDGQVVRQVLEAAIKEKPGALSGRLVLQMGTILPDESLSLDAWVLQQGGRYVEAPVLGSRPQACAGTLQILLSGVETDRERARPLLADLGEIAVIGEVPSAAWLKVGLNQIIASQLTAFSLSLGLIRRSGGSIDRFMEVLRKSEIYARTFDSKLARLVDRDFEDPNFSAELMLKDLELAEQCAAQLGLDGTTLPAFSRLYRRAVEQGLGRLDYSAVYEVIDPPDSE